MLLVRSSPKKRKKRRTTTLLAIQKDAPSRSQKTRFAKMLLTIPRTKLMQEPQCISLHLSRPAL